MGKNPDSMIKKAISEMIVEEMFRDLGFYVLKTGQENIVNPLTQLDSFIKKCGGKFKLKKNRSLTNITEMSFFQKMPDFFVVDDSGEVFFIEVKFSRGAMLNKKRISVLDVYPQAKILVINLEVGDNLFYTEDGEQPYQDLEDSSSLRKTRFHVWDLTTEGKKEPQINSLKHWLKCYGYVDCDEIIEKYEKLVEEWLH